jgi:hypothetical protein
MSDKLQFVDVPRNTHQWLSSDKLTKSLALVVRDDLRPVFTIMTTS